MEPRTFISFDWAIKRILRQKENFSVLEGLLSEILGFDIKIENLLESEGNKDNDDDKFNRVDILVKSTQDELMLIEVQYDAEEDYFHRMVYGISKLISEYISEGQPYGKVKKAYSINILYFRLGQGEDYIYEYEGSFIGKKSKDILQPSKRQQNKFNIKTVADIFPKYYILRVNDFKEDEINEPLDEWLYFLKKSEIKDEFKAKGLDEAKTVLNQYVMSPEERRSYQRHVENKRIEMGVMETAIDRATRRKAIDVAKEALKERANIDFIAKITGLSHMEIEQIAKGIDIDQDGTNS